MHVQILGNKTFVFTLLTTKVILLGIIFCGGEPDMVI